MTRSPPHTRDSSHKDTLEEREGTERDVECGCLVLTVTHAPVTQTTSKAVKHRSPDSTPDCSDEGRVCPLLVESETAANLYIQQQQCCFAQFVKVNFENAKTNLLKKVILYSLNRDDERMFLKSSVVTAWS